MRKLCCFLAALLLLLPLASCTAREDHFIEFELSESVYVDGKAISSSARKRLQSEIADLLYSVEDEVSVEKAESDTSRINAAGAGEEVAVGEHTSAMLRIGQAVYAQTGGAFSLALYNLSALWKFTPEYEGRYSVPREEPAQSDIAAALAASCFSDISLRANGSVVKENAQTRIDFGGIAKGYMGDVAADYLREAYAGRTVECTLGVLSGTVFLGQKHDGEKVRGYNVGIDNPRKLTTSASDALFLTGIADAAVSTSADTYRFYIGGGKIYPHIIDPSDGKPSDNGVISITAIVPSSVPSAGALADAYSTAGFCMPLTDALAFYRSLSEENGTGAVIITADFRYYIVGGYTVLNRKEYGILTSF